MSTPEQWLPDCVFTICGQAHVRLTAREKAVLALLLQGFSSREIAKTLHLGEQTVRNYASIIYHKVEVNSQAKLIAKYNSAM